tara:strand:- start:4243 stop:5733 length:1491 start_codon:yes stop_codon:yes gene_type:complete
MERENGNAMTEQPRINKVEPVGIKYPSMRKHEGYLAQRHLTKFNAENASVFTESNNVCRIPVQSGSFLDLNQAVLGFDLTNTHGANTMFLDDNAGCVVNRVRVLNLQGGELERLESYGLISNVLDHYTKDFSDSVGSGTLDGSPWKYDFTPVQTANIVAGASITTETGMVLTNAAGNIDYANDMGGRGYSQEQSDNIQAGVMRHYEIKLKGAWFNPDHKNYLPANSGFVLELTFGTAQDSFAWGGAAGSYSVQNCILAVPAVRISDPDLMARMNLNNRALSWTGTTFSHHINTTQGTINANDTVQLSVRCYVLKGLLSIFRTQSELASFTNFSLSKSSIQGLANYQYQIGSDNYPAQQIDINLTNGGAVLSTGGTAPNTRVMLGSNTSINISSAFSEVKRVIKGLQGTLSGHGLINNESYAQGSNNNGAGIIGVSTEPYGHDDNIHNGIDTASTAMPVSLRFLRSAYADAVQQIDTYACCQIQFMRDADGNLSSEY